MNANIDYDYDEVISFCKTAAQDDIINLGKDLNDLCKKMASCQDAFHTKEYSVISKIYDGFSKIIGNTNANTGAAGLMVESANIVNVCYSEAMQDKKIVEEGGTPITRLAGGSSAGTGSEKAGFWGRVGATLGTVGTGFVEGVVKFGESVVDGATLLGTAVLTIPTAVYDTAGAVISGIKGNDYDPITDDMWKASKGFVCTDYTTGWADSFYENTGAGQYLKDNAYAFDTVRGVSKFAGQVTAGALTGSAVASAISKGASAASAGTSLATTGSSNIGVGLNVIDKTDDVLGIAANAPLGLPGQVADDVVGAVAKAPLGIPGPVATGPGTVIALPGQVADDVVGAAAHSAEIIPFPSTAVSTVNSAASTAGNAASGAMTSEILNSAGEVIGTSTFREISSEVITSGAKNAGGFIPKAAVAGVGTAAAIGGMVENSDK